MGVFLWARYPGTGAREGWGGTEANESGDERMGVSYWGLERDGRWHGSERGWDEKVGVGVRGGGRGWDVWGGCEGERVVVREGVRGWG